MNGLPHTTQIKVTCRGLLYHIVNIPLVGHSIGGTDREHVIHIRGFQFIELPTYTAVELLVTRLLVAQAVTDAFGE